MNRSFSVNRSSLRCVPEVQGGAAVQNYLYRAPWVGAVGQTDGAASKVGRMKANPKLTRPNPLNFKLAHKIAGFITPGGPSIGTAAKRSAVESMRYAALASVDHVHAITRLDSAHNLRDSEVLIVDRPTWVKANAQSFEVMLAPIAEQVIGQKLDSLSSTKLEVVRTGGAAELGGVLAFLSTRVLGQYDPYAALAGHGPAGGRLMIVAPNLVQMEQELTLDPEDFRLWVCLHEQTHRVQFAAAPWLREYILGLIHELAGELGETTENLPERISSAATGAVRSMKGQDENPENANPRGVELLLGEKGKDLMDRVTAVMSLLEGHANVVMDAVDASLVPSVKTIRRRFEDRKKSQGFFPRFMSRLLGMDAKMLQYKNGQKFVQTIVDEVGMDAFNRIWESEQTLPTAAELHDPHAWITRVLGTERIATETADTKNEGNQ